VAPIGDWMGKFYPHLRLFPHVYNQ
jgi:hypothetical protein